MSRIHVVSRREVLRFSAGALILACNKAGDSPDAMPPNGAAALPPPPPPTSPPVLASATAPARCALTHDNIEGPYYRAGAPERWDLTEPGMRGTLLELDGRVTGLDCRDGLRDVELDVWHATADGHYDNDGSMGRTSKYVLRGKLRTDREGRYHVRTIVPGRYLNGPQYRPAHVHVKLRASGFAELTTQLYFPGDPYNDVDPFLHRSLIMQAERAGESLRARFDFVLRQSA